jgi:hypothetical protein
VENPIKYYCYIEIDISDGKDLIQKLKIQGMNKRDLIIDKQITRLFCYTTNVYQTPLLFYATQLIKPFLNSRISSNHKKVEGIQPSGEIPIKVIFFFFSFLESLLDKH